MIGILGEQQSDVDTLRVIIRRLSSDMSAQMKSKGYNGCGELLRKCRTQILTFVDLGCDRFVVCYDSDGQDPRVRCQEIAAVVPPETSPHCCIVIPVQELEAWLLV